MEKSKLCVVINPGHAVDTPGKCSPDKTLREYEWNRSVASLLCQMLGAMGIKHVLAQADKESEALTLPVSICRKMCKLHGSNNVLLISIHVNAAGNGTWKNARGWSVWTTVGNTRSDVFATMLHDDAVKVFGKDRVRREMSDGDPDYESNFYVLRNTSCPAVLIEHFFMDNKKDCAYLKTDECKMNSVEVICNAIEKYLLL